MSAEGPRYTAVFTGLLDLKKPGEYPYLQFDEDGAAEEASLRRGLVPYTSLGAETTFDGLSPEAQSLLLDTYEGLWGLRGKGAVGGC